METATKKLANKKFLEKAPSEIIDSVRKKVEAMSVKLEKLSQNLNLFESID